MLLEQQLYSALFFAATTVDLYLTSIPHTSTNSKVKRCQDTTTSVKMKSAYVRDVGEAFPIN